MLRSCVLCCAGLISAGLAGSAEDYRLSGPFTHDNLTIFLIHSPQPQAHRDYLTLEQALDQKKVVVYETGNVNELSIENLSTKAIYVNSGDIVKGGQQDRVFPDDYVLPPMSGKVPISSFCVEPGRWTRRGSERADSFASSTDGLPTNGLKLAARQKRDQGEVWKEVAAARQELAETVNRTDGTHLGVGSGGGYEPSAGLATLSASTSMQVTVEAKPVIDATRGYIKSLSKIVDRQDVVGYAFAINGTLNSADIYSSPELFRTMWPKLLKASAVEAVSKRQKENKSAPPDAGLVRVLFDDADNGRESSKEIASRLKIVMKETGNAVLFESRDRKDGSWIHKSYVVKDRPN
jgi:ARG/rhodanese/phosphatase superfamily protein